jgi:glycosyltransferase involved in cell wall biosynthesis
MKHLTTIALIIPSLRCGGAERIVTWLANDWVAAGERVLLITLDGITEPSFFPLDDRVVRRTVLCGPLGRIGLWGGCAGLLRLRRLIQEHHVGVAMTFVTGANVVTPLALYGTGIPVVTAVRDHLTLHRPSLILRALRPLAFSLSRKIVLQSDRFAALLPPRLRDRAVTIPNPIFHVPASSPTSPRERRILCGAGRLVEKKGFAELITEFARLTVEFPDWDLFIYGAGPERVRLEHLVCVLGLGDRVFLPGEVTDLPQRLHEADIFVLSSQYEGFPNTLCEAMAAGRAVVARDCPGAIKDIVVSGVSGIVFTGGIAEALRPLMSDEALRQRLGEHAREVAMRFDPEKIITRWKGVLSGLGVLPGVRQ